MSRREMGKTVWVNSQRIFDVGAYQVNFENPYVYPTGEVGPLYIRCHNYQNHPEMWKAACKDLVTFILDVVPDFKKIRRIAGEEPRDTIFSIPVSMELGKPHVIIKEKHHYNRVVTEIREGEHVLPVSDTIVTGKTGLDLISVIREAGGIVEYYVSFFDSLQGGRERIKEQTGVDTYSLVNTDEGFFMAGIESGKITGEEHERVKEYLGGRDGWALDYLMNNPDFILNQMRKNPDRTVDTNSDGFRILKSGYPSLRKNRDLIIHLKVELRKRKYLTSHEAGFLFI